MSSPRRQAISVCMVCTVHLSYTSTLMACRSARSCPARGHVWDLQPWRHVQEWAPAGFAASGAGKVFNEPATEAAPAPGRSWGVPQGRQRQPDQSASPA